MGNVHAYSSTPPPPGAIPRKDPCDPASKQLIENPGPLEEIHTKCKSMLKI